MVDFDGNRSTKFHLLAREHEKITHKGCYRSFYKFHKKLLLKIHIFLLQGSVRIQSSSLVFRFLDLKWNALFELLLVAHNSFTESFN